MGSIPGLGRSPGEEKGYPLQYSGLENPMDSIVHGVAKSRTQLSDFHFISLEGLIVFIEPFNFSFLSIGGWGILDNCENEWFALEANRSFCHF